MKANELMIGDWVLINGTPRRVQAVDGVDDEIMADDELYTIAEDRYHSEDKVDGVPLTPEILEKNGFVYNAIPFVDGWEQFGLTLYRGGNGYRIDCGINVSLIIDCVHELQHTFRICGIEKEITI